MSLDSNEFPGGCLKPIPGKVIFTGDYDLEEFSPRPFKKKNVLDLKRWPYWL